MLASPPPAEAAPALTRVSADPYLNTSSQHQTEVEPDTFAAGSTLVAAFQVGRFNDGGSSNIGWARFGAGAGTWSNGFLPGITTFVGGAYDRVSDPSVAYDRKHDVWLISSLALTASPGPAGAAVLASRSTDGASSWSAPVTVATAAASSNFDKSWIVCDDTTTSPHFGNCYVEWDDNGRGNLIQMSTSSDGGLTWGAPQATGDLAGGLGGQPVVAPGGRVVVPIDDAAETNVRSFSSIDGGATWSRTASVSPISEHLVAGGLRTSPLPSAEIDGAGRVYVVWQDCGFRAGCTANDIVMSSSADGSAWSPVARIPIDPVSSGADHFIPGLAVDPATSGSAARLALTYYYYPDASCTAATCQLDLGYVSSLDGGLSWSPPTQLAGPMSLSQLAATDQGAMVGDYMSTSFVGASARTVAALAAATTSPVPAFDEAAYGSADLPLLPAAPAAAPTPAAPPVAPPAPATPSPPSRTADAAPAIEALRVAPRRFAAAQSGSSVAPLALAAAPGSQVSYVLSQPATVTFAVARRRGGRRQNGGCAAPRRRNRGHQACVRVIGLPGQFRRAGVAGANRFRFTGRLRARRLAPGRYRLSAVARNGRGQASRPRVRDFEILAARSRRGFPRSSPRP